MLLRFLSRTHISYLAPHSNTNVIPKTRVLSSGARNPACTRAKLATTSSLPRRTMPHSNTNVIPKTRVFTSGARNPACTRAKLTTTSSLPRRTMPHSNTNVIPKPRVFTSGARNPACTRAKLTTTSSLLDGQCLTQTRMSFRSPAFSPAGRGIPRVREQN